jgi:hypothetical protein
MSQNIQFPTWREIVNLSLGEQENETTKSTIDKVNAFMSHSETIANDMANKTISIAMQMMINASGQYLANENIDDILPRLDETSILSNEFYTIYNIPNSTYDVIDESIEQKLSISKQEFTLPNLLSITKGEISIEQTDLPHFIRWAGIAFLLFSIPTFKFTSYQDYYLIKFKIIVKGKQALLEKKCYLSKKSIESKDTIPRFHFDKWTILPSSAQNVVKPVFVSDAEQTELMNNLAYLFNAALINFPVKYLIMLEERQYFDRNKEVGREMENSIKENANCTAEFSDIQIGDYFKKTIRKKIAETYTTWTGEDKKECSSETEAIQLATQLGLLPIPSNIKKLIYSRVS